MPLQRDLEQHFGTNRKLKRYDCCWHFREISLQTKKLMGQIRRCGSSVGRHKTGLYFHVNTAHFHCDHQASQASIERIRVYPDRTVRDLLDASMNQHCCISSHQKAKSKLQS